MIPFSPRPATGVTLAVSSTTGRVALAVPYGGCQVLVSNTGTAPCWVEFGGSTVEAAETTGMCIMADCAYLVSVGDVSYVAAICASGQSTTIYASLGDGN